MAVKADRNIHCKENRGRKRRLNPPHPSALDDVKSNNSWTQFQQIVGIVSNEMGRKSRFPGRNRKKGNPVDSAVGLCAPLSIRCRCLMKTTGSELFGVSARHSSDDARGLELHNSGRMDCLVSSRSERLLTTGKLSRLRMIAEISPYH